MSAKLQFSSFACKTAGCTGELTPETVELVSLQVGCHRTDCAIACPACGRIHWPNGNVVRNRQHDNAYLDKSGMVELRPMPAAEKKTFTDGIMSSLGPDASDEDKEYIRDVLNYLVRKGHAPDCSAKDDKGECNCSNTDAEKWIAEHPDAEAATAE